MASLPIVKAAKSNQDEFAFQTSYHRVICCLVANVVLQSLRHASVLQEHAGRNVGTLCVNHHKQEHIVYMTNYNIIYIYIYIIYVI